MLIYANSFIRAVSSVTLNGKEVINVNPHRGEVDQVAQHSFVGTALDYFNLDENRWWEKR